MVQWYTLYNWLHNNTKILNPCNLINADNQLFIKLSAQFQTISDRFLSQKSPKITVFSAKNASKNTVFGSFSSKITKNRAFSSKNRVRNHRKTHYSAKFCTGCGTLHKLHKLKFVQFDPIREIRVLLISHAPKPQRRCPVPARRHQQIFPMLI
jgi:hypothetical protein